MILKFSTLHPTLFIRLSGTVPVIHLWPGEAFNYSSSFALSGNKHKENLWFENNFCALSNLK